MVAAPSSNPTGVNILVNLFFQNVMSDRSSVRTVNREKPEYFCIAKKTQNKGPFTLCDWIGQRSDLGGKYGNTDA